jgi:hypothetical protein
MSATSARTALERLIRTYYRGQWAGRTISATGDVIDVD